MEYIKRLFWKKLTSDIQIIDEIFSLDVFMPAR